MKNLLLAALLLSTSASFAKGGTVIGNGGDYARSTFMKVGESVVTFLKNAPQGTAIVATHKLDTDKLLGTLSIYKIAVSMNPLRDNSGSLVDAIGVPDSITLNGDAWLNHFEKNRDVSFLVFHEMLRSAGVNDDNYVISGLLNPFPDAYRVSTLLKNHISLIAGDNLSSVIDTGGISYGGTGCPAGALTRVEFDDEHNILEANTGAYSLATLSAPFDRKACDLAIPVNVPVGFSVVFSQVDLDSVLNMSEGDEATISVEGFVPGVISTPVKRVLTAPAGGLSGRTLLRSTDLFKTACGANTILRLHSTGLLKSAHADSTVDIQKIAVSLKLEACTAAPDTPASSWHRFLGF